MKITQSIILFIFCSFILALSVRGLPGNPNSSDLNKQTWKENGPFELSPERGRFALLYSIVEDHSFQFSNEIGKFASPDVVVSRGKYASMFAPLVSFITIPGYVIGKFFGVSQVGAFAIVSLFAILNLLLLRAIAIRLGANPIASTLGAMIFLFATPAFSYAVNLYQHHISTFLILLSLYILIRFKNFWSLTLVFLLCAASIPLDYPNLIFMFPIGLFAVGRIITFEKIREKVVTTIRLPYFLTLSIMILPILFFLWFNQMSFGNPFQLSGTLPSAGHTFSASINNSQDLASKSRLIEDAAEPKKEKTALGFFQSRRILNGFYIHFISPDRGVIYYTPVILLGMLGAALAYRKRVKLFTLFLAIIGANVLLYSMWGDPWGGWAFGSRYLIPSYAILSIFIALLLTYWRKSIPFLIIFLILFGYSAAVNTLGAITTSAMPPQVEVLNLEKLSGMVQKYTYERNWDFLQNGSSKSFVYQTVAKKYFSATQYYEILAGLIILAGLSLTTFLWFSGRNNK